MEHCITNELTAMHFYILARAGASKPAPKPADKTAQPLPALAKPKSAADAAQNWLSSAMAEAKTPSANIAAASQVN
jgi:hypothetical protein